MAAKRRGRASIRRRGNRVWANISAFNQPAAGANLNLVIFGRQDLQLDPEIEPPEMTLLRIVGDVTMTSAVTGPNNVLVGLVVTDRDAPALTINSARLADERWLYVGARWVDLGFDAVFHVDVRGKVKLMPDSELRLVVVNVDSLATQEPVAIQTVLRALVVVK